ncbi:MAG: glycine--tRNA ligase subunit alpha [Alphaproteobacteria bacterium]
MDYSFQGVLYKLIEYWRKKGCTILQPYDKPLGAGTSHPATVFGTLGKKPCSVAYVQPSRRPADGRYGKHPNRLQHFYQLQVLIKPMPKNSQELYLESLKAIGLFTDDHDIRFVEDDWENPSLGASGLGWEVWCDGLEITQYTYFQKMGGIPCEVIPVEITYGLERIIAFLQNTNTFFDIKWDAYNNQIYGDFFKYKEYAFSHYNFWDKHEQKTDTKLLFKHFDIYKEQFDLCKKGEELPKELIMPAYDICLDANFIFNLLDARGALSVMQRASFIACIRQIAKECCEAWMKHEEDE